MKRDNRESGGILLNAVIIVLILGAAGALLLLAMLPCKESPRKAACQNNMKELGLALSMYCRDYDYSMFPSSALNGGQTWNAGRYRLFATKRGAIPPRAGAKPVTWVTALYPYMKNKDIIWCPSDPTGPTVDRGFWRNTFRKPMTGPNSTVSYFWKAAVDRGWFGGIDKNGRRWLCRGAEDFAFPSDQVVLYERVGWHWGDTAKGLSNGVTLNVAYMDGHVSSKRLRDAGNAEGGSDPLAPGEPGWFNCRFDGDKPVGIGVGVNYDARKQGDMLD